MTEHWFDGGGWEPPEGHPITETKARGLIALIRSPSRQFIASRCVPLFWFVGAGPQRGIMANGTVTIVQTPASLIGLTADHVIEECLAAFDGGGVCVQLADASAHDLPSCWITRSRELDGASFEMTGLVEPLGWKDKSPLTSSPPMPPREERGGGMIGGYPACQR